MDRLGAGERVPEGMLLGRAQAHAGVGEEDDDIVDRVAIHAAEVEGDVVVVGGDRGVQLGVLPGDRLLDVGDDVDAADAHGVFRFTEREGAFETEKVTALDEDLAGPGDGEEVPVATAGDVLDGGARHALADGDRRPVGLGVLRYEAGGQLRVGGVVIGRRRVGEFRVRGPRLAVVEDVQPAHGVAAVELDERTLGRPGVLVGRGPCQDDGPGLQLARNPLPGHEGHAGRRADQADARLQGQGPREHIAAPRPDRVDVHRLAIRGRRIERLLEGGRVVRRTVALGATGAHMDAVGTAEGRGRQ